MDIRCICHNISIKEISALVKQGGYSLSKLQENGVCATKCKLCIPYIEKEINSKQK